MALPTEATVPQLRGYSKFATAFPIAQYSDDQVQEAIDEAEEYGGGDTLLTMYAAAHLLTLHKHSPSGGVDGGQGMIQERITGPLETTWKLPDLDPKDYFFANTIWGRLYLSRRDSVGGFSAEAIGIG